MNDFFKQAGWDEERWMKWQQQHQRGRVYGGIILLLVGAVLLARQAGVVFPAWLFTWEFFLIVLGIYIGAKHAFHGKGWLIPIVIGAAFLVDDIYPDIPFSEFVWPGLIILVGISMIFSSRKKVDRKQMWDKLKATERGCEFAKETSTTQDYVDATSVFGSVKKHILSKNFKGGEITTFMGGSEINLCQADLTEKATLEVTQVFGGTRIVVPSHWDIQSEMTAVLGGIEDKRPMGNNNADGNKVLLIKGTTVFGGIEITSY